MTLDELNALPAETAERELLKCCGSLRWTNAVAARRPFASIEALQDVSAEEWWKLNVHDWREAFSHHPRIGDRTASGVAKQEQSGTQSASPATLRELERLNRAYESKFGFVFLIFASGKTAEEMLQSLETRILNSDDVEIRNAAREQAKITRLRLKKTLDADPSLRSG